MTIIIILTLLFIALWIVFYKLVRCHYRKTIKQIDHAHKVEQATLLDDDDIRWSELGIEYSERPFVKLHK